MVASSLFKGFGHIAHELEGIKFLDVQPLSVLAVLHDPQELVAIIIPLSAIKRVYLAGIVTAHNMNLVPLPT